MKRTHLPLNALRVFDAAARHLSFTRAADELAVTPAAVGQQIRALEDLLGVVLFRRTSKGLELTDEASSGLEALRSGFLQFEDAVQAMQAGQAVHLICLPKEAGDEEIGGLTSFWAMALAAAMSSAGSCTALTSPTRSASSAVTMSPVRIICIATPVPTRRGSRWVPP